MNTWRKVGCCLLLACAAVLPRAWADEGRSAVLEEDAFVRSDGWTLAWPKAALADLTSVTADMNGLSCTAVTGLQGCYPHAITFYENGGPVQGLAFQFESIDGIYVKCVAVVFCQREQDIFVRRLWHDFKAGSSNVLDFWDRGQGIPNRSAKELDDPEGKEYGICNLRGTFTKKAGVIQQLADSNDVSMVAGLAYPVEYEKEYLLFRGIGLNDLKDMADDSAVFGIMNGKYINGAYKAMPYFPTVVHNDSKNRYELILQFQVVDGGFCKCVVMKFWEDQDSSNGSPIIYCARLWRDYYDDPSYLGNYDFYGNEGKCRETNDGYDMFSIWHECDIVVPKNGLVIIVW